jgi:serine protease Do
VAALAAGETCSPVRVGGVRATSTGSVPALGRSAASGCAAAGALGVAVLGARETASPLRVGGVLRSAVCTGVRATRTGSVPARGRSAGSGCAAAGLLGVAVLAARETVSPLRVGGVGGDGVLGSGVRAGVRATRTGSVSARGCSAGSGCAAAGLLGAGVLAARETTSPVRIGSEDAGARATRTGSAPVAGGSAAAGAESLGAASVGAWDTVSCGAAGATGTGFDSTATRLLGARATASPACELGDDSPGAGPREADTAGAELAAGGIGWGEGASGDCRVLARATRAGLVGADSTGAGAAVVGLDGCVGSALAVPVDARDTAFCLRGGVAGTALA